MGILNNLSANIPGFAGGQAQQASTLGTTPNLGEAGGIGGMANHSPMGASAPGAGTSIGGGQFNPAAIMQSMSSGAQPQGMQPGMSGMPPIGGGMPPPQIGNSMPISGMPQGNPMFAAMMR